MIPTALMSPSEWPEEKRQEQEQYLRNSPSEISDAILPGKNARDPLEKAIDAWLLHSYPAASGESTSLIYRKILLSLRAYLRLRELDLDSPTDQLIQEIEAWATQRTSASKHQGRVAPSTYNQRIAAISSFYAWASKSTLYGWSNPAERLHRVTVRKYAESHALDAQSVRTQLKEIDRSTARGQRDYALLQVALNTGRSARELASLTLSSLLFQGEHIVLTFRGRSGKVMHDALDVRLSQLLLTYLHGVYGEDLSTLHPQAPVWVSFSDRTYRQAIGPQTIADICETHLGISKIHQLRHTFALTMDQLGAPIDVIQTRLGHESRSTTDTYLASLKRAQNPYAAVLADTFGLEADYRQNQGS